MPFHKNEEVRVDQPDVRVSRDAGITVIHMKSSEELVQVAINILTTWCSGRIVDEQDIETLRTHAPADSPADLIYHELARWIVRREAVRAIIEASRAAGIEVAPRLEPGVLRTD